jgi:hypothetical protein
MGRGGDTILAHINPEEAMLLDAVTDGGSINPITGMPEFFMDEFGDQESLGIGEPGEQGTGGGEPGDPYGGDDPTGSQFENPILSYPLNYGIRNLGKEKVLNPNVQPRVGVSFGSGGYTNPTMSQLLALNTYVTNNPYQAPSSFLDTLKTAVTGLIELPPNLVGLDFELTGKDLIGKDLSQMLAGRPGNQPAMSVEVNPLGIVGGAAAGLGGALVGGAISPTINVDTSGNVTTHGGIGNTIDQVSNLISDPPDIVDEIANALGITTTPTDEQQIASNAPPSPLSGTMGSQDGSVFTDDQFAPLGSPMTMPPDEPAANMTAISTMPQEINVNQVTQTAGIPYDYFEESNDPFFQTPLQMTSPQQVAEQIIAQQELVNALTQPGYTRAGQGRIYL